MMRGLGAGGRQDGKSWKVVQRVRRGVSTKRNALKRGSGDRRKFLKEKPKIIVEGNNSKKKERHKNISRSHNTCGGNISHSKRFFKKRIPPRRGN